MKVNFPRFTWLLLSAFLALGPVSHALVNTSDPADSTTEPTPAPTAKPEQKPDSAKTPPAPDEAAPSAPSPDNTSPTIVATPQPVSPDAPPTPVQAPARGFVQPAEVTSGPGDHHVSGDPAHDVVSIFGNSTADVDVEGAVVAVFGNSDARKNVSDAVVAVLGNSHAEGEVGQSVVAVLGNASANGHVHQNIVAVLGNIDLGPHAEIDGDVVSVGGKVNAAPGAIIHGHRTMTTPIVGSGHLPFNQMPSWFQVCLFQGRLLAFRHDVAWAWIPALVFLAAYILFGLVFSNGVRRCAETLEQRPGWTILATLLTVVLTPLLVFILMFTVFGGVFLSIAVLIAAFFGKAALYAWLGRRIYRESSPLGTALAVLIGGVIFLLLFTVPVVGFLAWIASGTLGLGLVVYTLVLSMRKPAGVTPTLPPPPVWPVAPISVPGAGAVTSAPGIVTGVAQTSVAPSTPVSPVTPVDPNFPPVSTATGSATIPIPPTAHVPPIPGTPGLPPVSAAPRPTPFVSAVTLPRATFGPRLLAALLDVVLVGFFAHMLHLGGLFLLLYTAYCVTLWTLKGTTIGGIICGLKLVRLDDRPIDWTIALIRALGAFLSLIVVGLGFLWVNFDDECQSWHDKIAGTTIVRMPKGHSLV